jgi:uncharacterized protein DUF4349
MKPSYILAVLVFALMLSACGAGAPAARTSAPGTNSGGAAAPEPAAPPASDSNRALEEAPAGGSQASAGQAPADQQALDRLVIKTADVSLEVEKVGDAETAVRALAARLGGYVVKVETSGTDENLTSKITFRVPAQRFDDALSGVQGLAKKVLGRTVSGEDVTAEFVDLDSRVRNLEATRDRLLTFLDKATKVEDALAVNNSLNDIQGQIEQAKGRMQYLKQSSALSTITVALTPVPLPTPIVEEGGWQPVAVARAALRSLIELGQGLASVAIVVLVWTPVWLPLLLLGLWIRRRVLGRTGKTAGSTTSEVA